ncbi:ROK family protein [Enterococcus timonensis]|uniref:ROK family protein n=1 Tax=Enterococcus timonensis TaxID=1852364 RepID=UPI0008D8D673|nr:ROK family protein [Enterococcus timonensis]
MILSKYIIREQNEATVLKAIIDHYGISRAQVSTLTHLNKASVSSITKTLLDNQLIFEIGIGDASALGGRKPIRLEFNGHAGIGIALDIGYNYITAMMAFLNGDKIAAKTFDEVDIHASNIMEHLEKIISHFEKIAPETPHGIIGISLAVHGIVSDNQIAFTPYYDLDKINLQAILEEKYNYPIILENEANLTALGEYCFSDDQQKNVVSVSVHSGIGAGIVLDGKLHTGLNGTAGEIGHTILVPHGKNCPCGNHGCLEQYASNKVLFENYAAQKNLPPINSDDFTKALQTKEMLAEKLMKENMELLAIGLNNVAMMYNPEVIFINSSIYRKNPDWTLRLKEQIHSFVVQDIVIKNGTLADLATLYGGIANLSMNFLNISQLHFNNPLAQI